MSVPKIETLVLLHGSNKRGGGGALQQEETATRLIWSDRPSVHQRDEGEYVVRSLL